MRTFTATVHFFVGGSDSETFLFWHEAHAWARQQCSKLDLAVIDGGRFCKVRGNLVSA